jgi:hypothetical protein
MTNEGMMHADELEPTSVNELRPEAFAALPTLPTPNFTCKEFGSEDQRKVCEWNAEHQPGCAVLTWQSLRAGSWMVTKTIGRALIYKNRAAVYCLGYVQPVFLANLRAVPGDIVDRLELMIPRKRIDGKAAAAGK